MTSEVLVPILIFIVALLMLSLIVFFINKTLTNRIKIKILSDAKIQAAEYIERNASELSPLLTNFYGEQSEHYLNNIKKENQVFFNQLVLLLVEYKSNLVSGLTNSLELLNQAYINVFHEASKNHHTLNNSPQPAPKSDEMEQEIKEMLLIMSQLCNQELDEKALTDEDAIRKIIRACKEKIKTMTLENKTQAEESTQYLDLIEQIRIEKKSMRQIINQALKLLEQIYQKYELEPASTESINFKQFNYDELVSAFKLNEPSKSE